MHNRADTTGRIVLHADRFHVERVKQVAEDGRERTRDVIRHPGAVAIIPLLDDDQVCLIRNYRITVAETLIELPAGTLEPPEPPEETARRELIEETGFRCQSLEPVTELSMSPGILDERMHVFVARGLTAGKSELETGE